MKTLERLLTMFIAVTLALSVLSVGNPSFFTNGLTVYADEDDEEDNDNSGSDSGSDEEEHEEEDDSDEESEEDDVDEEEQEEEDEENEQEEEDDESNNENEEEDEDDNEVDEDDEAEQKDDEQEHQLRENSKVKLQVKEGEGKAELEIQMDEGDIEPGIYNVTFSCTAPEISLTFTNALAVEEDGEADFETEISLEDGMYQGCNVAFETINLGFEPFIITGVLDEDEEQDEEDEEAEEEEETGEENESEVHKSKFKLDIKGGGIEIEVELEGITLADGSYDAMFACTEPVVSKNFTGAFVVEDGEGEFEEEIELADGTYNGCQLTMHDIVVPFDSFTVASEEEEPDEEEIEKSREERRDTIVSTVTGAEIHQKHLDAQPTSTGDYHPGWNYSLTATGIAEGDDDMLATAVVETDLAVWKSTTALILLDVTGGHVEIGDQTYTIAVGYALYGIHADILRIKALVVDDATGDVLKLRMSGSPIAEDPEFPTDTGSLALEFEGHSGPSKNELDGWELTLDGVLAAV